MVFQSSSVRNGEIHQMEAKVLPIGFMRLTNRLLQFVILRHFLKYLLGISESEISKWDYVWEFGKGINRIGFAQTIIIPIVVFIQIIQLLRFLRLDRIMGTLLMTIKSFLKELAKLFLLMLILIIPYGLMQENFLYPNQYLTT